eukprot:scaffold3607_cov114-Isochrysis_galbana.AAC.15
MEPMVWRASISCPSADTGYGSYGGRLRLEASDAGLPCLLRSAFSASEALAGNGRRYPSSRRLDAASSG